MLFEIEADKCVSCLACVRVCPVDAVGVEGTQVAIVDEACIRCGICAPACPHDAIDVRGNLAGALELAGSGDAVLILSVEAEVHFHPRTPEQLVNACYRAGFAVVYRGVVGDELVADAYRKLWGRAEAGTMIRSTCPVVVDTVRRSYPELVPYLAPVQTPVQAEAAYIRARHGRDVKIVYTGLCLTEGGDTVDASITLAELEELFRVRGVNVADQAVFFDRITEDRRRYDSTAGGLPLTVLQNERQSSPRFRKMRGLGRLEAIARAVAVYEIDLGFVDLLPCEGCLDHPLAGPGEELFLRRKIQQALEPPRSRAPVLDPELEVDVTAGFQPEPEEGAAPGEGIEAVVQRIGTAPDGSHWDCGACGYSTCVKFASAFLKGRATLRQCPPHQERRVSIAQQEAAVDELTGLASYRVLRDRLRQETARARRTGVSFAVLFVDMDRFKRVNDEFGHQAGNRVLAMVAGVLSRTLRTTDMAARFGGDEFVVLLIGTNAAGARKVGEQIRQSVEKGGRDAGYPAGAITVSVGAAHFDPDRDHKEVLEAADRALYRAKAGTGNRVV